MDGNTTLQSSVISSSIEGGFEIARRHPPMRVLCAYGECHKGAESGNRLGTCPAATPYGPLQFLKLGADQ